MSALVQMAGSGSRFSVKASSFESGEMAKPPPPSSENGGTSWGSFGVRSRTAPLSTDDEKEVGSLVAGEVVPVAVEEMGEDLRLYFAVGLLLVAISVALVAGSSASAGRDGGRSRDKRRT